METNLSFEGDDGLLYEESGLQFPPPFTLTPPGHSDTYDLEPQQKIEKSVKKFTLHPDPEASLNVNTNANTRGDSLAYVELTELLKDRNQEHYWQETGRWVGYEESYDLEKETWGSAHISYLTFKSLIHLRKLMSTGAVVLDLEENSLPGIAENIVTELLSKKEIRPLERDGVLRALLQKRSQASITESKTSGIEMETFSVAKKRDTSNNIEASLVLTGALDFLYKPAVAFIRLKEPVVLESALEASLPVRFIFVLIGPGQSGIDYHESGRAMAALLADNVFNSVALMAESDIELTDAMADFMDCTIVIPPTEIHDNTMLQSMIDFQKNMLRQRFRPSDTRLFIDKLKGPDGPLEPKEDPLARTGRPFGGLINDIKRRYKYYISDFIDGLNPQVLAAVIFIYFAALSPAITFGGLLADKTEHMMGVSELMISTCIQGIVFCLFAAQPILVIGFSGPLLVFEESFFAFCKSQDMEYIVGRVWVGIWLMIIVVVIVAVEGSFLVRFISRFTQEIFSILISLIFIYETFAKLFKIFKEHPLILNYEHLNDTMDDPFHPVFEDHHIEDHHGNKSTHTTVRERPYPNTALLSMCLMFGCFFIAYFLRQFKNGHFLPGWLRRIIGDFGVPIAIFFMIAVDISIEDAYTQKLVVPKGLTVSNSSARGWIINPFGVKKEFPIWMMVASVVPAMLVFILIFLESQITTLIVSKPERKMAKGSGFHLDLLIIVMMGGIGSFFGVPWLSAATVRSVTHANALTIMSKGPKPEIERVVEQRVSGILVAVMVGVSILMEPILKMIPMTALFGIFLYMGITSLSGIQLWDRTLLMMMPRKYFPPDAYASRVKTLRMHLFTIIQIACFVVLWLVKISTFSLALPFVIILTIPLRILMTGRIFTHMEMKCLDADDAKVTFDEEPGEDVYTESPLP